MPEGERSGFVTRKEFYSGMVVLCLSNMLLAIVLLHTIKASEDLPRLVEVLTIMALTSGAAIVYMIRAFRERSRPAGTPSGQIAAEQSRKANGT
jgi:hypothetical protein